MQLLSAGHSIVGKVRKHNEDSWLVDPEIGVFAVADGLGGHAAGEHASDLAVTTLAEELAQRTDPDRGPDLQMLLRAFDRANAAILAAAQEDPEREGMGTTLTALLVAGSRLLVAHVGDSRAWRLRDGSVEQLTRDHTVVGQQLREGILTPEQAEAHPMRHVLSRCLGAGDELEVDLMQMDMAPGDMYLIASDGIVPGLDLDEVVALAAQEIEPAEIARELVSRSCERDGSDNITAVVVRCRDE